LFSKKQGSITFFSQQEKCLWRNPKCQQLIKYLVNATLHTVQPPPLVFALINANFITSAQCTISYFRRHIRIYILWSKLLFKNLFNGLCLKLLNIHGCIWTTEYMYPDIRITVTEPQKLCQILAYCKYIYWQIVNNKHKMYLNKQTITNVLPKAYSDYKPSL